jgi:protein-S-isoprenylcysteine O-methyltransferase Ste14
VTIARTEAVVVAAWSVVLLHNLVLALRASGAQRTVRGAAGVAYAATLVTLGAFVERLGGGRVEPPLPVALAGAALAVLGAALHVVARARLGASWATQVTPRADARLVADGPYAVVRHPLYVGLFALGLGTLLAHPSLATACGAIGLAGGIGLKIRSEERALAAAFGERWAAYRSRVPCLVPRLSRGTRP